MPRLPIPRFRYPFAALALLLILSLAWAQTTLTVLSLSEQHGAVLPDDDGVGGLAQMAALVAEVRSEGGPVLVLSSGDILIGTVMSSAFRGEPDILAMNLIGFDAMVLGNHEFDFGLAHLDTLEQLADFPLITTNVVGLYHRGIEAAVVKRVGGVRVAVLGVTNPALYDSTSRETRRLTLADAATTIQRAVDALRPHVDVVIVATHQTTREDIDLLREVDGIDLVVGGHTEGFDGFYSADTVFSPALPPGPAVVEQPDGLLVKPRGHTEEVARVGLVLEGGRVARAETTNLPLVGYTPEPAVEALIADYEARLSAQLSEVLATAEVALEGERGEVRSRETNLGNLIADSLLAFAPEADIAFVNGGGIRTSVAAGPVTLGNVIEIHPFGNTIVTFALTGTQVRDALEHSVAAVEDAEGRFLQVAGVRFSWDPDRPPGERIVEVEVGGAPLDEASTYTVVTNNFIAEGGDGFEVFMNGANLRDSQLLDADVLADYLRQLGTLRPTVEGRIVAIGR